VSRAANTNLQSRLRAAGLSDIAAKLEGGIRLDLNDGVRLFEASDLLLVGWLANREREKRHGGRTFYNYNIRIEATNVCVASCLFCSFARLKPGDADAYTMSLDEAWDKLRTRAAQPLTEVHVVNGLHPDLPFSYYTDLLRGFKRIRPNIHLKCFTAVEIAFFADLYTMTDEQVLRELMAAGRRSGDLRRTGPPEDLSRQVRRGSLPRHSPHRSSARHAFERHDALRPHRNRGRACRSHAPRACAAG
jgi:aminodeoxyfutalosine synthase